MITGDPITPENGHWENNIAVQFAGTTASKEIEIPAVDINYGYGNHVQLKIEMPIMICLHSNDGSVICSGNVKIGAKARFLDEEISGIAVSTYPQYEFNIRQLRAKRKRRSFSFLSKLHKRSGGFILPPKPDIPL